MLVRKPSLFGSWLSSVAGYIGNNIIQSLRNSSVSVWGLQARTADIGSLRLEGRPPRSPWRRRDAVLTSCLDLCDHDNIVMVSRLGRLPGMLITWSPVWTWLCDWPRHCAWLADMWPGRKSLRRVLCDRNTTWSTDECVDTTQPGLLCGNLSVR